jgi:hypothetical protein
MIRHQESRKPNSSCMAATPSPQIAARVARGRKKKLPARRAGRVGWMKFVPTVISAG